ncbi:reverse transcriptase N-terminal domain-containing protein [Orientia tsutsugamushi]|uniref:reverse transcriptase N-terminal domain-containing protein n=1 Tax=Orientia tsutsugamushi TaxID=784 RepID=UPI000D5A5EB3|nr:reverse transcriptase [Orientia tsutsugamushi]
MMVVNFTASASTDNKMHLHSVNWKKYNKVVRSHQTRIVNAIQESRWNKAKALQRLFTHFFSSKAIAVRRVKENLGKRTAGLDWETWFIPDLIHNPRSKCRSAPTVIELKEA